MRLLSSKQSRGGYINYKIFLQRTLLHHDNNEHNKNARTTWGEGKMHIPSAIINHIQDSIARSALEGKAFHNFFALSDTTKTGLVTRDALRVTLCMLGCKLSNKDEEALLNALPTCCDGMVDYEALHRQLINHPSPPHMTRALHLTSYNGGGVLSWPPSPPIPLSTGPSTFCVPSSDPTSRISLQE